MVGFFPVCGLVVVFLRNFLSDLFFSQGPMISSTPLCSEEGIKYTTLECEALLEQQRPISLKLVFGSIAIATAMVTFWFAPEASSSLFVAPRTAAVPRVSAVMWATPAEVCWCCVKTPPSTGPLV